MAKWHYYNADGEKIGPIRGRELKQLAQQGMVTPETRVEDENGKTALAKNVTGLTFSETVQPSTVPPEVSSVLLPPSAVENLSEQDFDQLRGDIERLQKQQEKQRATQNVAIPAPSLDEVNPFTASMPVEKNPFAAPMPAAVNPFATPMPQSTPLPIANENRMSFGAKVASTMRALMDAIASMTAFVLVLLLCGFVVFILVSLFFVMNPQTVPPWLKPALIFQQDAPAAVSVEQETS